MKTPLPCLLLLFVSGIADEAPVATAGPPVHDAHYFDALRTELRKQWPANRTLRFVFHGHSVPAGYFKTPTVRRFDSYPTLFHQQLCEQFPTAVIDVNVTAIGGENSVAGAKRFEADVIALKPDVVFIDYALNDRRVGLEQAKAAWRSMIERCLKEDILVVLLTPTPDQRENILDDESPLEKHAAQVRELAAEYKIPLVDSYAAFRQRAAAGDDISAFMSQSNHPNRDGHVIVVRLLFELFAEPGESPDSGKE